MNAKDILEREFLGIRAKILEVAASLDRIERAEGTVQDDSRSELIQQAIAILSDDQDKRAERVQLLFSRDYDPAWKQAYQIESRS